MTPARRVDRARQSSPALPAGAGAVTQVARPRLGPLHEGRVSPQAAPSSDSGPGPIARGSGTTGQGSGVLHEVRALVQYAQPLASTPPPSCSRPSRGRGSGQGQVEPAPPGPEQVSHKVRRVRGHPDPPQGPGLDHLHGSVSTQRTSAASPSTHPTGILGILRFLLGLQRLGGVDVRCMDIYDLPDRPHQLVAASKTAGPAGSPTEASTSEAMTLTCLRSEETRQLAVQWCR